MPGDRTVNSETIIGIEHLNKWYGNVQAVKDVSLAVGKGETFGFLGPNGAGKTTTIRCILGLLRPDSGQVRVLGKNLRRASGELRRVGYVPGELALMGNVTGEWHVHYIEGLRGTDDMVGFDRAKGLADQLDLNLSKKVRTLSKGNKQKLALVLALMDEPDLLILDEPTSGLDPLNQETVFDMISERVGAGATVFLSSHVLSEVERVCKRVAILREGVLVDDEAMEALLGKRLRELRVSFDATVRPNLLYGIEGVINIRQVDDVTLTAEVRQWGVDALLKRLALCTVTDCALEKTRLEDAFLHFYRDDDEITAAATVEQDAKVQPIEPSVLSLAPTAEVARDLSAGEPAIGAEVVDGELEPEAGEVVAVVKPEMVTDPTAVPTSETGTDPEPEPETEHTAIPMPPISPSDDAPEEPSEKGGDAR